MGSPQPMLSRREPKRAKATARPGGAGGFFGGGTTEKKGAAKRSTETEHLASGYRCYFHEA